MNEHLQLDDEARDRAVLFAMELLPPDEATAFEAHVAECARCSEEVRAFRGVIPALSFLAPRAQPPAALRRRVLQGVVAEQTRDRGPSKQVWKNWEPDVRTIGLHLVRAEGSAWEPTGFAGIEVRRLSVDVEADRVTMLVRMAAGASYFPHRHAGPEECYVLNGDLEVGSVRMHAGDYQRAEAGSEHGRQTTEAGCTLLIVSSLEDELLEPGTD